MERLAEALRLLTDEAPMFTLYYNLRGNAHTADLKGPLVVGPRISHTVNVYTWEWRS